MRSLSSFYRGSELDVKSLAEDLPQLPGTLTEVEAIAKSLDVGKDDIKLELDATETAVKQSKLDDYRIVYFATHGLVAGDLQGFTKSEGRASPGHKIIDENRTSSFMGKNGRVILWTRRKVLQPLRLEQAR